MVETWIKSEAEAQSLRLHNYTHYYNYRSYSRGGGVSIYVHNDLKHNLVDSKCKNDNHYLWIHIARFSIDIGAIYKPERTNNGEFFDTFSEFAEGHRRGIIFGDFNFDLLKNKKPTTANYIRTITENGYTILNKITKKYCTRETSTTKTILDHVCSNIVQQNFHMVLIDSTISDHKQIYLELKQFKPNKPAKVQYTSVDYKYLHEAMKDINYVDNIYIELEKQIQMAITKSRRSKIKIVNPPQKDWINKNIINKIDKRNELWRSYKENPKDKEIEKQFKEERNKTFECIQNTKNNYYYCKFKDCEGKPLKMWQLINNLTNNKVKENSSPLYLLVNNTKVTDPQAISEHFNDFFSNIGLKLANNIPNQNRDSLLQNINTEISKTHKITTFEPATVKEIKHIIKNLKNNASAGIDGVTTKVIKCIQDTIVESLTKCINKCLADGYFPDTLKLGKVSPIYKSGAKHDPSNYRPISVLPTISKIFEKVIHNRLVGFLKSIDHLSQHQYGFRTKSSTLSATIDLTTKIKCQIDQKQIALGIFIDLKKAFDTVSHEILIHKLSVIGLTDNAINIIKSYLANRFQVVKINENISSPLPLKCGVPQGSILGPLLFLIYINNIHNIGLKGHITLYADDTCLFYFGSNINEIVTVAQNDLDTLQKWFSSNLLTINTAKTNYIIFAAKNKQIKPYTPLTINSVPINKVNTEKYLGLILDSTLTWKPHIDKIKCKLTSLLGCLRRIAKCLPITVRYTIYNSLVKPHIDYLIEVWGSAYKTNLNKLQILQNKIIKVLFHYNYLTPTTKIYKETKLMNLSQIYKYNTCILIHKILHKEIHSEIIFTKNVQIHKRNLRRANNIYLPKIRTNYGKKNIMSEGAILYNSLPNNIKLAKNINSFKSQLKSHIFKDNA